MTDIGPVRFSHLRAYGRSGAHGYQARFGIETEASYAMERGTAVHALLFGNRKVAGWDGPVRRGKAYDEFAAANPEVEILTAAEYEKASQMVAALRACSLAAPMLKGAVEQTLLFRWMGMDCRSTPDVRGEDFVTELKTTNCSAPERFQWHALRMHYHAQLHFEHIAAAATGAAPQHHYIVAVESAPPYPVTVFKLTDRALEAGEKLCMLWMEKLRGCELSGEWPPYAGNIVPLDAPEDLELEYGDNDE